MPLMSLFYEPVRDLAIVLIGGIMVSAQLFLWAIRRVDWREMMPLFLAIAVSIPGARIFCICWIRSWLSASLVSSSSGLLWCS